VSLSQAPPAVTRDALDAFERQSGLPDVSKFLIETGRVMVIDAVGRSGPGIAVEGREVSHAQQPAHT